MGSSCCKGKSEKEKSTKIQRFDDRKPVDISSITTALNKLAVDLYTKINSDHSKENIFFSPLSIALALALVETGATGKTQEEIQKLIKPNEANDECGKLYGDLQEKLMECTKSGGQLRIANSIFHDDSMVVQETFLENVKEWLKTEIFRAPFSSDPKKACQQINQWVSDKTAGKIPRLFGELSVKTACVLVNAIYMKMDWLGKFDVSKTKERVFYRFGGMEEQMASFMCRHDTMYHTSEELQAIELPYKGGDMSMYVILPRRRDGMEDIEKNLSADFLMKAISDMRQPRSTLYVEMPKFTMRFRTSLLDLFAKLGFSNTGELGRMSNDPRLYISQGIHESYAKVDEKGTEAAAATGMSLKLTSERPGQRDDYFIADHPFLFFIVHKPTWAIVFMGKINYVENKE